ncbi:MFS transporter [Saccharopolyspora flava]|uniref:Predicted arabinose efflux permease, MFS family n=1 Tax=Saccharopolyspora flava TaxID=95161 RepID=A0A1I6RLY1_9PSEU|nr:MFS transporter [Saccharopolyspora flava]SFS65753.1 Predicted arabinose efflux permease, MFS family [Saccharopolyspora flava]
MAGATTSQRPSTLIIAASTAGTVVEWYDFFIYGTVATLVFGKLFFPEAGSELVGIIAALGTYAVGFIARPIGGVIFGHFGDTLGRKKLLQLSLLMIGLSTVCIGLLPTYGVVGVWAPVMLVALRFIQGIALGGEWGGAVLLVSEHGGSDRRGLWASFPQAAVPAGNILATAVLALLSVTLSENAFLAWGWRIAFLASAALVLLGYYIRMQVEDAPVFKEALAKSAENEHSPLREILRTHKATLLKAMGIRLGENTLYYMVVSFSITYLKVVVGTETIHILELMLLAHLLHLVAVPLCGYLSDKWGRKPVIAAGLVVSVAWAITTFSIFDSGRTAAILSAIMLGLIAHALMYGSQAAFFTEMFPTRMRYTGISIAAQVTSIVAGALAPIIAGALLAWYGGSIPITAYVLLAIAISGVAVAVTRETNGVSYDALDVPSTRERAGSHAD